MRGCVGKFGTPKVVVIERVGFENMPVQILINKPAPERLFDLLLAEQDQTIGKADVRGFNCRSPRDVPESNIESVTLMGPNEWVAGYIKETIIFFAATGHLYRERESM